MQQPSTALEADATPTTSASPAAVYAKRHAHFTLLRDQHARQSAANGNRNVLLFLAALAALVAAIVNAAPLLFALTAVLAAGFVVSFAQHGRVNQRLQRLAELVRINEEGQRRLRRDWTALPLREPPGTAPASPLADDLDLLGRASLQHLLGAATTPSGQALLRDWLLTPAAPETIRRRQAAVAELAPQIAFRQELALGGMLMGSAQASYLRFLTWAEAEPWLRRHPVLAWLARLSTVATLLLIVLQVAGVLPYPFFLAPVLLNIILSWTAGHTVDELLDQVADRQSAFTPYADLYALIAGHSFSAPELRRVRAGLATGDVRADVQMRWLGRIMSLTDLRLSMFYPVLQALTLWSFHTLWLLEGWQRVAGRYARGWLAALSEMEALAALAALAFDEPEWAFPEITQDGAPQLEARALGHPLLAPDVCVRNDVTVGPAGTFLLVTGSNMSGKSTLLRAIGLNVVLAQAGGPVCAAALRLPPVLLATSIRVRDSLEEGVSYFMAELRRLKDVVDAADEAHAAQHEAGGPTVLYLLDEILHGTNTGERQIAARRIMRHLLAVDAIGAVSTHDLTLAAAPELTAAATLVHFTEQFTRDAQGRPAMTFDYRLRPGLATSSNALKLMEIVGLDVAEEG